jgi:hypothetical protein
MVSQKVRDNSGWSESVLQIWKARKRNLDALRIRGPIVSESSPA